MALLVVDFPHVRRFSYTVPIAMPMLWKIFLRFFTFGRKKSRKEIGELMKTLESPLYTSSADDVWDKIKECQSNTDKLNSAIYEAHGELALMKTEYNSSKEKFKDLVEVERNKNKKLKKISATLQFIQNLKKGTNERTNDEGELKKKLEEINDLYR